MRKHLIQSIRWPALAGLACLVAVTGRVYAEGEGWFLNGDVGATFLTGLPSAVHTDPGVRFSLVPGYRLYNNETMSISLQFETGVIWNHLDSSASGPVDPMTGVSLGSPSTDLYQVPFMAGFEYAFHAGSMVVPYIGIAGGGVYNDWQSHWGAGMGSAMVGGPMMEEEESPFAGAVQGMAGVRFKFSEHMELGVGYKYLASFPTDPGYLGNHSASLVFVWRF
jgi:opacity protein-like surface antigen